MKAFQVVVLPQAEADIEANARWWALNWGRPCSVIPDIAPPRSGHSPIFKANLLLYTEELMNPTQL